MAYMTQDPNLQQGQPGMAGTMAPGQSTQAPMTSSGAGAGPTGGKSAPTGVASNQQAPQPFTNLNAYLTANAPQVQKQADTISGNLTSQYGQTQNDINAGTSAFNQQVAGGYAAPNAQVVQQAAADPTNFAQNPSNVSAFQGQLNDQYTGPANFEGTAGYAGLNNEVNTATQNAAQVNTLPGLQTYLQGTEKNPTQGENTLDSVLLNQSPDAIQQVQAAAAPFSQLPSYLAGNVTSADANAAAAPGQAAQAAHAANAAFLGPNGVVPTWEQGLQNTLAQDTTQANQYNTGVNNLIGSESDANPQLAAVMNALSAYNTSANGYSQTDPAFGATSTLPQINGIDLQSFNNPNTIAQPTLNQAASAHDVAEQAALAQLLGQNFNPYLTDTSQAGSFKAPGSVPTIQNLLSPQLSTLGTDITGAQNAYTANGVLNPNGTPSGSIVNKDIVPFGDVLGTPKGSSNPVFLPGAGVTGADRGTVSQTANTNMAGTPQAINFTGRTGLSNLVPISQKNTAIGEQPYTSNAQLPALQQAYQSLQQYLAAQGG